MRGQTIRVRIRTHFGEFLQGVFSDSFGMLVRALLSAPCAAFVVQGVFHPDNTGHLVVAPASKRKALRAAYMVRDMFGAKSLGGILRLTSNIPPARGGGESTGDVQAAAEAVAAAIGVTLTPEVAAHICVAAETASDGIMFGDNAVLFAQRLGMVVEDFHGPIPEAIILGFDSAPDSDGVDTLAFPPAEYNDQEQRGFTVLRAALRRAICQQDLELLARVSHQSAAANERFLPNRAYPHLAELTMRGVCLGSIVSHSGTLAGAIFRPRDHAGVAEARRLLECAGFSSFIQFNTRKEEEERSVAA